jgi:transcriptional regulator with XRE-family HTH domain
VIRIDSRMDRKQLAKRAGISYSYLTEIENGNKPPSSAVLREIAHALGLRMSQLTEAAEMRLEADAVEMRSQAGPADCVEPFGAFDPSLLDEVELGDVDRSAATSPPRPSPRSEQLLGAQAQTAPPRSPAPGAPPADRDSRRLARVLSRDWAMQPSLRGPDRELRSVILELEHLLRRMAPDDIERLLDYARRLVR